MLFNEIIYAVFLDGNFVGITNDELECWEIAEESVYGTPNMLHHDDVDRVNWHIIDINRFNNYNSYSVYDKLEETKHILCYNRYEADKCCKEMNKLYLTQEKLEAKKRAMNL